MSAPACARFAPLTGVEAHPTRRVALCKDCRAFLSRDNGICNHELAEVSLVNGNAITPCEVMRSAGHPCGRDGALFRAREA